MLSLLLRDPTTDFTAEEELGSMVKDFCRSGCKVQGVSPYPKLLLELWNLLGLSSLLQRKELNCAIPNHYLYPSSQQWHPAEHRYEWMWKQMFFYFLTFSCIFCPQVVTKVSSKTKQDGRTVRSCGIEDSIETWKPAVSPSSLLSVLQHFPWRKWGMAAYA